MMTQTEDRAREAVELVAKGALLLDVRTPEEFATKHLPGALNVPVQELLSRLTKLGPGPRDIVVYCRSGIRSAAAAAVLRSAGHRVLDLGAMDNWPSSGACLP
jgi:rhodanese-related sulfurtransferase